MNGCARARDTVVPSRDVVEVAQCPVCSARVPPGASNCPVCRMNLAGLRGSPPPSKASSAQAPTPPLRPSPSYTATASSSPSAPNPLPFVSPRSAVASGLPTPAPPSPGTNDDELDTVDDATHRRVSFDPGTVVDARFSLRRPLGEGALGTSWLARDVRADTLVVLKVVGDSLVTNDRERAELVSKLGMFVGRTLPGVVMPREVFAVPGSVVLVYPYVEATTLRDVIDARHGQGARFTPEECLRVAQALVASVQAMHAASPHGALWPRNVLVTARGLLLVDGLLATSVAPDRLAARVEHHPSIAPFCAPEITAGRRPTASADLYGIGAILAELAGGAPPGSGPDLAAISHDLHRAVSTLLDREPARRPAGIRLLLDALTAAAGFSKRPSEAPLPLPETVLAKDEAPIDPPTLPPPVLARNDVVIFATHEPPTPPPSTPSSEAPAPVSIPSNAPLAASAERSSGGPPGRLRGPTATLPLTSAQGGARAILSGPPPTLAVKSGPPQGLQPLASQPVAAQPPASKPVPPQPIAPKPVAAQPPASKPLAASKLPPMVGRAPPFTSPEAVPLPSATAVTPPTAPLQPSPAPQAPEAGSSGQPVDPRVNFKTLPSIREAARMPPPSSSHPMPGLSGRASLLPAPPPSPSTASAVSAPTAPPTTLPANARTRGARSELPRPLQSSAPAVGASRPPPPPRPPARPPAPPPSSRDRSFDDEGIDPKLLRIARMLDDERRRDASTEVPPKSPPHGRPRG